MFEHMIENVINKKPLIHCITNYVTVNDVANMILACHGSPIMADEIEEVEDITTISDGLVINIGTLNKTKVASMIKAGKKANALNHPVILDPVGAGASHYRTEVTYQLLKEVKFSVIKGNITEIKCIALGTRNTSGVDASDIDQIDENNHQEVIELSQTLSQQTGAIIVITGKVDIISNDHLTILGKNGHPMMSNITGTGCMLSGIIASYVCSHPSKILEATACAITLMNIAGEIAYQKTQEMHTGTSSFRVYLIDQVSLMDETTLKGGMQIEIQ